VVSLAFLLGVGVTLAVTQFSLRIPSTAAVVAVGLSVWRDEACTVPVSSIDWGVLAPDESKNLVLILRSESNVPVTLSMNASGWNPPQAANYIQLSWNYNGVQLQPQTIIPVTFTLTVNPSVSGISSFSFEIVLVASG
jgi:hypothetical protein